MRIWGLGFTIWGLGFRAEGLRFGVWGLVQVEQLETFVVWWCGGGKGWVVVGVVEVWVRCVGGVGGVRDLVLAEVEFLEVMEAPKVFDFRDSVLLH